MPAPGRKIEVDYDRDDYAALLALYDSWAHPDRALAPTAEDLARVRRHLERLERGWDLPVLERLVREYAAACKARDLYRVAEARRALFSELRETEIALTLAITDPKPALQAARQLAAAAATWYAIAGIPNPPVTPPPVDPEAA